MRIFVGSPIYMAGTAPPAGIFLFKPADSLSGVTDVKLRPLLTSLSWKQCGLCQRLLRSASAVLLVSELKGPSTWSALDRDGRSGSTLQTVPNE